MEYKKARGKKESEGGRVIYVESARARYARDIEKARHGKSSSEQIYI